MVDQNRQRDELERLIGEVQEADRAGVFARTPVDLSPTVMVKTVGPGYGYRVRNRLFIGLQVAACIALVAGLATLWQPWSQSPTVDGVRTTSGSDVASVVAPTHCGRPETLIHCFLRSGTSGGWFRV